MTAAPPLREALALAALARECAASGAERRVLLVRLSRLRAELAGDRHRHLLEEALEPLSRPARGRLYALPGGDLVAVAPPPGEHLLAAREALRRLLPDLPAGEFLPELRLPAQSAALLAAVEEALGLAAAAAGTGREGVADAAPPPPPEELEAAERALAAADISAFLRGTGLWRFAPGDPAPARLRTEHRPHLGDLAQALLPGFSPAACPWAGRRFRAAAERRMLAGLARPEAARGLGPVSLPLTLAAATSPEFLRLEATLGPEGRRQLLVCLPPGEVLAEPGLAAALVRFAALRGWSVGLDEAGPDLLPLLAPRDRGGSRAEPVFAPLRLRFGPELLSAPAAERAALDAALPEDRAGGIVLSGAEGAAAIGWAWRRGIEVFAGSLFDRRAA